MTATRNALVASYFAAVDRLIASIPIQANNRPVFERFAAEARIGTLTRTVRTKLHHFPEGTPVLFVTDPHDPGSVSVWCRRSHGETRTLVAAADVAPLCEACEGSGYVRPHPSALVSVHCGAC